MAKNLEPGGKQPPTPSPYRVKPCYSLDPEITLVAVITGMTYLKLAKRFTAQNFD